MPAKQDSLNKQAATQNRFYSKSLHGLSEAIRASDGYGQPIGMNFENKQTHQTFFGGLVTIVFFFGFSSFFIKQMTDWESYYLKD